MTTRITTDNISDGTIENIDIKNGTIDITSKVTGSIPSANLGTIPVSKGGTGLTSLGGAGQAIKVNSSGNALEFGTAAGLVFLNSATASSSSSLDFTSNINSTYNSYLFVLESLVVSSTSSILYFRTSTDGGSSFDAGSTAYQWSRTLRYSHSQSVTGQWSNGASQIQMTPGSNANTATNPMNGYLNLYDPTNASSYTYVDFNCMSHDNASDKNVYFNSGIGQRENASDVDAVRFLLSTGTFTSGAIRMYGRVKS